MENEIRNERPVLLQLAVNLVLPLRRGGAAALSIALLMLVAAAMPLRAAPGATPPGHAVVTAHPLATEVGIRILNAGGNAFDAAVAVSAALAVVEPAGSGFGGGGFWLLHRAQDGRQIMLDGRERAPLAATPGMFANEDGEYERDLSLNTPLAAGIPGQAAALVHLNEKYGRLSLEESLAPAIRLARKGFPVDERMHKLLQWRREVMLRSPAAARVFLTNGAVPRVGHIVRQDDLAKTLERLADSGRDGFYKGKTAEQLLAGVKAAGGLWTQQDLDQYQVVERQPVSFDFLGHRIVSASPPSGGGTTLRIALGALEGAGWAEQGGLNRKHLLIEAMRRAYRVRALYLGDPDFNVLPMQRLLSPRYSLGLARTIRLGRATPSSSLPEPVYLPEDGPNTTHFSIMDAAGNRVAGTLSINYPFGAGFMPPGTGVLLNNEMDDFAIVPLDGNSKQPITDHPNAVQAGRRMLSSMSPTFIEGPDRIAVLGTPGGKRIISMVLSAILGFVEGQDAEAMVATRRIHHSYLPDEVLYEDGAFNSAELSALAARGHTLTPSGRDYGNMQVLIWNHRTGELEVASDKRGIGRGTIREVEGPYVVPKVTPDEGPFAAPANPN